MKGVFLIGFSEIATLTGTVRLVTVTYYRDVLPILQSHCQSCHHSGGQAPMSLMSYSEVKPWAEAMKQLVISGMMPPRYVRSGDSKTHELLLLRDIDTIVEWVDQGAPAGNPEDAPPPVYFYSKKLPKNP